MVVHYPDFVRGFALPAEAESPRVVLGQRPAGIVAKVLQFVRPKAETSGR